MDARQPASAKPPATLIRRRWRKRWWFRALAGIVIFIVSLFAALPFAAKYGLTYWLKQNGADQAVINSLRYNPFLGRASLRGLVVDVGGRTLFSDGLFTIDLSLRRLFSRDIHVEDAYYHDLMIDIEQKPDGVWRFGSYSLTPNDQPGQPKPASRAGGWIFSARNVTLAVCQIHFKTPEIDLTLMVDEARLQDFSTSATAAPAGFHLRGKLNGEAVDIRLDALKIAPSLALNGQVNIAGFDLAIVKKYVEGALPNFAGKVRLDGKAAFSLDNDAMQANYNGVIGLIKPSVGNRIFNAAAKTLSWNGAAVYRLAKNDSGVTVNGTLAAAGLALAVPGADFSLKHDKITLSGDYAVPIVPALSVHHDGTLETAGTVVDVHKMRIQQQNLTWQGKTDWAMPGGVSRAVFAGVLATGDTRYANGSMRAGIESMHVGELTGNTGTAIAFKSLAARGLSFTSGDKEAIGASVEAFDVGAAMTGDFINWQTQNMSVKKAAAQLSGAIPVNLSLLDLHIGQVSSEGASIWRTDKLSLRGFVAGSSRYNSRLASLGAAKVTDITAKKDGEIKIGELDVGDLRFLGFDKKDAVGTLDRLLLRRSTASLADGFSAASLSLDGLEATLEKDKEGTLNVLSRLQAMQAPTDEKAAPKMARTKVRRPGAGGQTEKKTKALPVRIGEISLNGHIFYRDKTLPLDFASDAEIEKLTIKNLDSGNPESKSRVALTARLAGRAPLEVQGDLALFTAKPEMSLDIHLKNYPLSNLSPYTAQAVGTALASGELKADAAVSLKDDYLKVESKLLLQKLETKTLSPELAAELNNQLPMPLDAALALLRDSKRNITLNIPVEGELSSLRVGVSSIVISALSKAIVPAASAYLVYALGPYGALAYVGMKVGEKVMQVNLPPVEFAPGQHHLTPAQDDYLERIGKILADRPETDLQLIPKVVADELNPVAASKKSDLSVESPDDKTAGRGPAPVDPKLMKKLEELGQKRGEALRRRLHEQFGVDVNRLMISETQIVPDGKPEVLLSI